MSNFIIQMAFLLTHLRTGWDVDQAILYYSKQLVCIRFGHDYDPVCMKMDQILSAVAEKVKKFCVIFVVDITEVPYFNKIYELNDPMTVMFFFRNKMMKCDYGTGEHFKMNFLPQTKQQFIDIVELLYDAGKRGMGKVISPINYASEATRGKVDD